MTFPWSLTGWNRWCFLEALLVEADNVSLKPHWLKQMTFPWCHTIANLSKSFINKTNVLQPSRMFRVHCKSAICFDVICQNIQTNLVTSIVIAPTYI